MLVSILVTNYNYELYLNQAIESCLGQTYPEVEVVVVDDGSSDSSRQIIEGYADSVVSVFKVNGGLSSATNAAFAACHGELVCLLDSDDLFAPTKVERLVDAWRKRPDSLLIYHQLQTINSLNVPNGAPWPSAVWNGDISGRLPRSGGWWPRPTTSGLAFARSYLERVLPMPTGPRIFPDSYLTPPAAMLAPVIGIPDALASYRVHGKSSQDELFRNPGNSQNGRTVAQRQMEQYEMEHELFTHCLEELMESPPSLDLNGNPEYLAARKDAGHSISTSEYLRAWTRCPAIPNRMRPRLVAKAVTKLLSA